MSPKPPKVGCGWGLENALKNMSQKSEKLGVPRALKIGQKVVKIDSKRGPKEVPISRGVPKGSQGRPGDDFGAILGDFCGWFLVFSHVFIAVSM